MKVIASIMFSAALIIGCAGSKSDMSEETERRLKDIEEETRIKIAEIEAAKELGDEIRKLRPKWVDKRPYVSNPNIIEGVGVSPTKPTTKAMRQIARDDAIAEISISTEVNDTSYVENYFKDFEEHYTSLGKTRDSREELQTIMRNNVLNYITLAETWMDPKSGEYWYYAYMLKSEIELSVLESAKEQATINEEMIIDYGKDQFSKRIEEKMERMRIESIQQREIIENILKQLLAERANELDG